MTDSPEKLLTELRAGAFAVAYRTLGSVSEAEDVNQEALPRPFLGTDRPLRPGFAPFVTTFKPRTGNFASALTFPVAVQTWQTLRPLPHRAPALRHITPGSTRRRLSSWDSQPTTAMSATADEG